MQYGEYLTRKIRAITYPLIEQRKGRTACPSFSLSLLFVPLGAGLRLFRLVGAERMSRILDWEDRSTCVIFGDGAGAAVLGEGDNYLASKLYTRGGDDVIKIPQFIGKSPFFQGQQLSPYVHMKGQETFRFAVNAMCGDVKELLDQTSIPGEDIAWVVPHQANVRIIESAKRKLPIPEDRFFVNIDRYGNTSAASIPMALDELNRAGKLRRGDNLVLCAFGGGLASAACILRW